ncbi:hypothetical protein J3Q64DRAFT_1771681 [Phycomyces blakesleeanus]|uniref:peptidylprolyl isomerase n=2 Tax=Phycomyces blakesleeanus TaxID=4837 RepID=A0A167JAM4_PHYB8|nr:hypothetical protein PHYBLDRAFT_189553 [Phycomyces blakesleeanus NRRL 1555(-)]OAD65609.1 hypothetical protein PHYBLDRAFT_189553 [Phycomyces blakesleeanus NRRL 1555(-)]|eukprot:XP_018283649.1 hypothetical protein PHYBLDRAFT_189553 [Phycomyces blakesleeanus NRRL 1555(-)]
MATTSTQTSPVSLTPDNNVTKRIIRSGQGQCPKADSIVSVHYESFLEDGSLFDSSRQRNAAYEFVPNGGKVIKAWEIAIPIMHVGELAEIVCTYDYGYGKKGWPPIVPQKANLRFEVELLGTWESAESVKQKISVALAKKEEGNAFYKQGAIEQALFAYRKGREYVVDVWDCEPEDLIKAREVTIALHANVAACYMKMRDWDKAIEVCQKVLDREPRNIKACYRIGQAYYEKDDYENGIGFVTIGLRGNPDSQELKALLAALEAKRDQWIKTSKELCKKMLS